MQTQSSDITYVIKQHVYIRNPKRVSVIIIRTICFADKAVTPPLGECASDITEIPLPKRKNVITEDKKSEEGSDGESWQQV